MFNPPEDPDGCLSPLEHERRYTALADELEAKARELLADAGGRIAVATANQLAVAAINARYRASKLAVERHDRAYSDYVIEESRKLQAGRKK